MRAGDARAIGYAYARAHTISDAGADAGALAGAHAGALREAHAPADAAALSGAYRRTKSSAYACAIAAAISRPDAGADAGSDNSTYACSDDYAWPSDGGSGLRPDAAT